jgi:hypothetical protein
MKILSGGVQAFPANLTMIGFLDLQPTTSSLPDRCFICKEQKQGMKYEIIFKYLLSLFSFD